MDRNAPREDVATKPLKPARVALNVLALCFALSVLGRGLGESFTVFLKPISEGFGWDRAQVVSVYSLAAMAVVYSATGAGVLILLPASQVLIDHCGWRGAYQIFGGASLLLLLPLLA